MLVLLYLPTKPFRLTISSFSQPGGSALGFINSNFWPRHLSVGISSEWNSKSAGLLCETYFTAYAAMRDFHPIPQSLYWGKIYLRVPWWPSHAETPKFSIRSPNLRGPINFEKWTTGGAPGISIGPQKVPEILDQTFADPRAIRFPLVVHEVSA